MTLWSEISRKSIHLGSSIIPLSYYWFFDQSTMLWMIGGLIILGISVEWLRVNNEFFHSWFKQMFGFMLRSSEASNTQFKLTGATWVVVSQFIVIAIFSKPVAILSLLILSVSDSVAAITGKFFNGVKIGNKGKTLQGSIAFFLSGAMILLLLPFFPLWMGLLSLTVATFVELFYVQMDDNLTVPIANALTLTLLGGLV